MKTTINTTNKMKFSEMNLQQLKSCRKKYNELLRLTKPSNRMVSIGTDTDPRKRQRWEQKLININNCIAQLSK